MESVPDYCLLSWILVGAIAGVSFSQIAPIRQSTAVVVGCIGAAIGGFLGDNMERAEQHVLEMNLSTASAAMLLVAYAFIRQKTTQAKLDPAALGSNGEISSLG